MRLRKVGLARQKVSVAALSRSHTSTVSTLKYGW
jgi:hypothetical protein